MNTIAKNAESNPLTTTGEHRTVRLRSALRAGDSVWVCTQREYSAGPFAIKTEMTCTRIE